MKKVIKYGTPHYRDAYRLVYEKGKRRGTPPLFVIETRGSEEADLALIYHETIKMGFPHGTTVIRSMSKRQFAAEWRRVLSKVKTKML